MSNFDEDYVAAFEKVMDYVSDNYGEVTVDLPLKDVTALLRVIGNADSALEIAQSDAASHLSEEFASRAVEVSTERDDPELVRMLLDLVFMTLQGAFE